MENSKSYQHYNKNPKEGEMTIGWQKMKENFLVFFLMVLLAGVLEIPMGAIDDIVEENSFSIGIAFLQVFGFAYWLFLLPVFQYGIDLIFLRGIRNENPEVKDVTIGFNNYVNIVLANLLKFGLVAIALVALIIPGIVVACRLAFVSYLVMDKGLNPIEAVEQSWKMTSGRGWHIFGLYLAAIFICIGGLLLFIVGIFPALMWISSYMAVYYQMTLDELATDDIEDTLE
ncbi:MAG: hypothetical protein JXQ96_04720 [Cyclobacteriaceae bacterium]